MTNTNFESILTKLIAERGVAILDSPAKCNGLLQDYAAGGFKREIRLLMQALDAGYHKDLLNSGDPEITRAILVKKFQDEYGTAKEVAKEMVHVFAKVLEDGGKSAEEKIAEKIVKLEKPARDGNIQAQYELGVLLCERGKYQEAAEWLKMAAKRGVELLFEEKPPSVIVPENSSVSKPKEFPINHNMILIKGGTFFMGSPAHEIDRHSDELQHQVTVSSFYMGEHAVTQKEYQAVMGIDPCHFKGDNLPAENISWYDAIGYCNRRSQQEGLMPAYTEDSSIITWNRNANGYRLPTEAEWEYACRAGTTTPFSTGNNITTLQANYDGKYPYNNNAKEIYRKRTINVGSFAANPWGLYNMHGNVFEWCWDWYGGYANVAQANPAGADSGNVRVLRGGGWDNSGKYLRSACRYSFKPHMGFDVSGFRLVRNVHEQG